MQRTPPIAVSRAAVAPGSRCAAAGELPFAGCGSSFALLMAFDVIWVAMPLPRTEPIFPYLPIWEFLRVAQFQYGANIVHGGARCTIAGLEHDNRNGPRTEEGGVKLNKS